MDIPSRSTKTQRNFDSHMNKHQQQKETNKKQEQHKNNKDMKYIGYVYF